MKALWLTLLLLGTASAQPWTVQVAAYTNERQAQQEAQRLEPYQLGHYLERSGENIRVRVGCFGDVEAAGLIAEELEQLGFDTGLSPLTPGLSPRRCVTRSVGFVTPERWSLHRRHAEGASFWVELGGRTGFISYDQNGWRLTERDENTTNSTIRNATTQGAFSERDGVVFYTSGLTLRVAQGQLLWQTNDRALILEGNKVSAYVVHASQAMLETP